MIGLLLADELEDAKKGIVPTAVSEPQVIEKVVEVEKVVEKIVEIEKPIEKIVEVIKDADLSAVDEKISTIVSEFSNQIRHISEEIKNL